MTKIKEIAEKSEGRVIIATLPKAEPTEKGSDKYFLNLTLFNTNYLQISEIGYTFES